MGKEGLSAFIQRWTRLRFHMKNSERTLHTRETIHKAYLELRRHKTIDQIRITELCKAADTNRTTFYHYFQDIYALNDAVENAILENQLADFPYQGLIYEDPERFIEEFNRALAPRKKELDILGHGREYEQYVKIEHWLILLGRKDSESMDEYVFLSFVIGGAVRTVVANREARRFPEELILRQVNRIVRHILKMK